MKNTIFLLLVALTVTTAQAQQKVTLAQCQGDTIAYLKQNFGQGKARFIGQPFSKIIKEWKSQIPIARIIFGSTGNWPSDENQQNLVNLASMNFITVREENLRNMKKETYYVMAIAFAPPFRQKINTLWSIQDQEDMVLGPRLYEQIKDYIVQDIFVVKMR